MKRIIPALLFLLSLSYSSFSQTLYDINTVQKIEIVFRESNWDYMLDTAKAGKEDYILAQSVTINGVKFDSVGVKYKGNSTYNSNQIKNPFHIELDTYKEQDYEGFTDIKLSNVAKDPSFVREVLSYAILRNYMAAPLSNYANVYVNGKLLGLYVNSESVSKKFVDKHFYSKDKAFFKCNPIDGAGPGGTSNIPNLVYLGADSTGYYKAYEMNSTYGWKDLMNLCSTLNNDISSIEKVLDVDRALWMLAFDNVLVNLDSYIGVFAQNYYLYKDDTGRFNCVLWDFNESFGTFSQSGTINFSTTSSKSQMTHLLHASDSKWPLVQKLLSVPTYKKMYLSHMYTIVTENFSNGNYLAMAQSYLPIINSYVQADPNKFFTYAQYQSNLLNDVSGGGGGPIPGGTSAPGITALMNARSTYLLSLTDFSSSKPEITNINISESDPKINSIVFITAKVTSANSNSIYLGYRANTSSKFLRVLMYDDGLHGDGMAGDNTYGASITLTSSLTNYYIYAENNTSGMFSPVRAEYEFYCIKASNTVAASDVVMNEVYSRGISSEPDWVEIYNNSSTSINISGYKIYDIAGHSGSKPKKQFPSGTIIPANGFYVIVTDDSDASGFGLSNNGEKVWFENSSGVVIDTVTYLGHTAAQSYGRVPDGKTWNLLNRITKGISNGTSSAINSESKLPDTFCLMQNYPNPFNPSCVIEFAIPVRGHYSIKLYDSVGQEVRTLVDGELSAGLHRTVLDGSSLSSGVYFYRLVGEKVNLAKKMLLTK